MIEKKKPTRIYKMTCPTCGRQASNQTELGVEGGDYADYPLNRVRFECECGTKFTIPLPNVKSEIERRWEVGERI